MVQNLCQIDDGHDADVDSYRLMDCDYVNMNNYIVDFFTSLSIFPTDLVYHRLKLITILLTFFVSLVIVYVVYAIGY